MKVPIINIGDKEKIMFAEMTYRPADNSHAVINLKIPASELDNIVEIIRSAFTTSGYNIEENDNFKEKLYNIDDVFPEATPGMLLRGLRGKMELTQTQFAKRIGVSQHHISEMENNKRKIGIDMAKRIAGEFNIPYKIFF
jgi:DNA-binding XRE family transcriptional regulator